MMPRPLKLALQALLIAALAMFYIVGATEHGRRMNISKARGDQSGYLWDAENVYANWHGRTPPILIGERNRMPLYAGYLALFYNPSISDDEYFVVAKRWNIRLSLVLLAILYVVFLQFLPRLVAANLTLVVAFGYFVFKAAYAQSELLFYFLFFLAFLSLWRVLTRGDFAGRMLLAAIGGALAALAYLTKAAVLPLVAIFIVVFAAQELSRFYAHVRVGRRDAPNEFIRQLAPGALVIAVFLAVLSPYLVNNKLAFGHYFYNVNTTFYAWYDDWAQASVGTIKHGDSVGWPTMPAEEIPGPVKYWNTHTSGQIARRIAGGFKDIVVRSYSTYWYFKYVVLYLAIALAAVTANRRTAVDLIRSRPAPFAYVVLYQVTYLFATAFYAPVSGTGTTRFVIANLTPLFFTLSWFFAHPRIAGTRWNAGGKTIALSQLHIFISLTLAVDLAFTLWARLMITYGGF